MTDSNPTPPEDVRRAAMEKLLEYGIGSGMGYPEGAARGAVDLIAPLIIEWARKDQAEVDAQIVEPMDGYTDWKDDTHPGIFGMKAAALIRTQFTDETGGE